MILEKGVSAQILERLMSSYGVNTQKDLAIALAIPANKISGWIQRESVTGKSIIKCALDTGADLEWLITGKLANTSFEGVVETYKGEALYNGGRPVLRRIMDAYGFTLQKQFCELLGISSGTVRTWVRRNYFPGDVVVTCAPDTGVSLEWLATGKELHLSKIAKETHNQYIPHKSLSSGVLKDVGTWLIDLSFILNALSKPVFISSSIGAWIVDLDVTSISNGRWLIGVDDKYDVYDITLLPGRKINVARKGGNFICNIHEINTAGKVILAMNYTM